MAQVDQRYAQALFELVAAGRLDADTLARDVRAFTAEFEAAPGLRPALESPAVAAPARARLIALLAARLALAPLSRNFLLVLSRHGRMARLELVWQAYEELERQAHGRVRAEITSARELEAAARAALEHRLAAVSGRRLEAGYRLNPELLAGFVARIGDTIYDASLRGRLERLRRHLRQA